MPTTPKNQPQSNKKQKASIGAVLVEAFSQALKNARFNGIPLIAGIVAAVIIKIVILIQPGIPEIIKQATLEDAIVLLGSALLIIFIIIINYLNNSQSKFEEDLKELVRETERNALLKQKEAMEEIANLEDIKKEHTDTEYNEQESLSVEKELSKAYAKFIEDNKYVKKIKLNKRKLKSSFAFQKIDDAVERLKKEIEQLSRRANINLAIGSTITIAALVSLSYFIVHENFNSSDIKLALFHFLPRLSLVIFIEFFSFFFLKIYRANLQEIKYYQNELTNIEIKAVAIKMTVKHGSKDDVSVLVKDMSLIERNFKLQKGESTVDLERNKAETHDLKEVLKALIGAYKKDK